MARTPRRKKGAELPENIAALVRALEFVALAQSEEGTPQQTHCIVRNRMIVANNGIYAMGHPIPDDVSACPHTKRFLAALLKCDGSVSITVTANGWLNVKAGKFKAEIPTMDIADLHVPQPDASVCGLDSVVRDALAKVAGIAKENAPRVVLSSVLLRANTAAATTGTMLLEAWHGVDLPTMALPKKAVAKLLEIDKPFVGFGFGGSSATFHFDDGSFFRTQLYTDQWPDIDRLLNEKTAAVPLPADFWPAIEGIRDFVENGSGFVVFSEGKVSSAMASLQDRVQGRASYELASFGIDGKAIYLDLLDACRPHMGAVDFISYPEKLYFFGAETKCRGIIMYGRPH